MNIEKLRVDKDYLYNEKNELVAFVTGDKLDFILDLDLNLKLELNKWFAENIKYNQDKLKHILKYDSLETMLDALPEAIKVDDIDFNLSITKSGTKYVILYKNNNNLPLFEEFSSYKLKDIVYDVILLLRDKKH